MLIRVRGVFFLMYGLECLGNYGWLSALIYNNFLDIIQIILGRTNRRRETKTHHVIGSSNVRAYAHLHECVDASVLVSHVNVFDRFF